MALALSILWANTAGAAPDAPIVITTASGPFAVTERAEVPPARLDAADRTCVIDLQWSPAGTEVVRRDCAEAVVSDVVRTVSHWVVAAPPGTVGHHDLGEVWFVYPVDAEDRPRVLVRQGHDRALSLPPDVDAVPFVISAWSFVRYPEAVHGVGVPDVSCTVHVRADLRGVATDVKVEDCGDPYREAARSAIAAWRFEPPMVGGEPIPTGLTLRATFVSEAPPAPERFEPSAESQRLWAERQFGELSRSERIRFIEAALLGEPERDLGPGQVLVSLPDAPDLGGREPPLFYADTLPQAAVPPLPEHPPILVLGKPDAMGIEVFTMSLPVRSTAVGSTAEGRTAEETLRCPLLVQVDGERRVFSWADAACDPEIRGQALATADAWVLRHDGPATHSARARFEATLVFEPGGASHVVVSRDAVRTPLDELPPDVHTSLVAKPTHRIPPRLPRELPLPDAQCVLAVTVSSAGHPKDIRVETCPQGFEQAAVRAVKQWRWRPAEEDAVPVQSETVVTIRFSP